MLDSRKQQILVKSDSGKLLRVVDCILLAHKCESHIVRIVSSTDKQRKMLVLKVPHEYDLVSDRKSI